MSDQESQIKFIKIAVLAFVVLAVLLIWGLVCDSALAQNVLTVTEDGYQLGETQEQKKLLKVWSRVVFDASDSTAVIQLVKYPQPPQEATAPTSDSTMWVGGGPYIIQSYNAANYQVTLKALIDTDSNTVGVLLFVQ